MTQSSAERTRKMARIAVLTALAVAIWTLEKFFPRPVPWLKPGFSYIVVLVAMDTIGIWGGVAVAFLRVFIGSLLLGKLLSPSFVLSMGGTVAATAVMSALFHLRNRSVSFAAISVAGAFAHIAAQIIVAGYLFYKIDAVLWLLPPSTLWTIVAGTFVGIAAQKICDVIKIKNNF
jgi:heptaprenyl diphosphate synthase